nr:MAG TPA: hypothetical protein [Caudoviricetes sp.]
MKPTWGIRKLNEYSISKDTAIIITDSEKDNYYWADIPDGSLLVNEKTGNLSIKLTGESDWVPMGIRKDGTDKLVKDAVINVEYYTIVKFELEHNRFYYHDREEITRIGKLIDGKAQFKVGSGLYIPGTNQLEVLINDTVRCNTLDDSLEEINMKYFQIDADDIRLGSTVTVRYINYERLSELYPFIFTQEQYPWFFEDKDIWINTAENVSEDGLAITPMSYTVSYPADDPAHANITVFTTKKAHLIATHRQEEYYNATTKRSITKFKVPRKTNDYYLNLFSTYFGYQTNYSKALIKGTQTETDKLTLDAEMLYPSSLMARASVKTQIGNTVTFKRNDKKLYASQNIGMGVQYNLPREENPYEVVVTVHNPSNGLSKEKTLTVDQRKIVLTADISYVTTVNGTEVVVTTIPGSKINIAGAGPMSGGVIAQDVIVDDTGRYIVNIPLAQNEETYNVIVSNDKADNRITETINILLHNPRTPLSVYVVDGRDDLTGDYEGTKALSIQAESGSTIIIKDASGNTVKTRTPSNLSTEETLYRIPFFYYPEVKTFTVESVKTNKVPESKTVTIEGYKKVNAQTPFNVNPVVLNNRIWDVSFDYTKGSTITAYDANNNIIKTKDNKDNIVAVANETIQDFVGYYYSFKQKNNDYVVRFTCTHPLYNDQEVTRTIEGAHLPEHQIELLNTYVINPYADMYNSDAYQVLELKLYKTTDDLDKVHLTLDTHPEIQNNLTLSYGRTNAKPAKYTGANLLEKINGSKTSYLEFYGKEDLSNEETLTVLPKINDYLTNAYEGKNGSYYFIFKVDNFYDLMENRVINIKANNKDTVNITVPTTILHWKNLEKSITLNKDIESSMNEKYREITKVTNTLLTNPKDNSYSVGNSIKYIHPNLVKLVILSCNTNAHTKLNSLIEKFKELKYFNDTYKTLQFNGTVLTCWNDFFYNNYKYLDFNSKILLFPNIFSYLFVSAYFNDHTFSASENGIIPAMYLNCEVNDDNVIHVKSNNQEFLNGFYNVFDTVGIRRFNSNLQPIEKASSVNLAISYSGKKIPSFFLGDYNHLAVKATILAKNIEEVSDNGLPFFHNSFIFMDYTKIKKLNNFSFSNPFIECHGIQVKNIGSKKDITIVLKEEEYIDNGIKYRLIDLPNDAQYSTIDKMYPFPITLSLSDPFNIIIKCGNNHLKIQDLLFSWAAVESITIESPSITLIDEEGDVISHKNIPKTPRILGMNRSYNTVKSKYNIPNNLTVVNYIKYFSHFGRTNLKFIDLRKYTNYYLHPQDFFNNSKLNKIIFPDNYIGRYSSETVDAQECLSDCYAIYIDNLDFITSASNIAGNNSFFNTKRLETEVNLNYFKEFRYSAFSSSNAEKFIYRKRTLTTDCLGEEVVLKDGYLESLEKGNLFPVIMSDTSFYRTNMTQESFDRIKNNFVNFAERCFSEAKQIKEVVLNNSNLKLFNIGFRNVNLEKLVIDSPTIGAIIIEDSMLNNSKLNESSDNYKINAPNAKVFIFENKGGYSTYHTLDMPNLEYSYFASPQKRKTYGYNPDKNEDPSILARHVDDFGGTSNGVNISYYNDAESIAKANLEELDVPKGIFMTLFSNAVNKNDIKIKKIKLDILGIEPYSSGYVYNYAPISSFVYDINYVSRFMEKYRWPALEEIIIKNISSNKEYTNLGVKIKYVKA